jgi:hypothetical protein
MRCKNDKVQCQRFVYKVVARGGIQHRYFVNTVMSHDKAQCQRFLKEVIVKRRVKRKGSTSQVVAK